MPELAIPLVFRLLGETGSHASVLNDVVLQTAGRELGGTPAAAVRGRRLGGVGPHRAATSTALGRAAAAPRGRGRADAGWPMPRRRAWAGGWSAPARAMLTLARQHALDRVQFGRPIASFQAVRHRLAETLVAIEGAEATLSLPGDGQPRSDRAAGQGRGGQGRADRGPTLPAGARRHRLHRRTRPAPPREAGPGARRIARQLKGTHPQGRSGAAGPRLGPAPGPPLLRASVREAACCTPSRRSGDFCARSRGDAAT